jgi:hypothetical protein
MSKIIYYQEKGGEEQWHEALADSRQQLIATVKPRFITVLSVSSVITDSMTREDFNALKYSGPLYFDWDAKSIEECLPKFRQFLDKLLELGVDLSSIRLYATGGRGFHAEVPQEIFISKPPKQGVAFLPAIYKEMCFDLYTDTMDLRVYTARRGRMWRTENVKRENGKFKVPLTVDEALHMTVDDYATLCSTERSAPPLSAPVLNQKLAVMYVKAEEKVAAAAKKRKNSQKDLELLQRFKGQYPPSLLKVMAGEGSSDGIGFHQIAMQIAITTNAIGKKEEEMLALCDGLIQNHQSDGYRYNTPQKRASELSRMYRYTCDNVCYTYNRDAVRKLVPSGTPSPDLDGLSADAGAVVQIDDADDDFLGGVFFTESGVFRKGEDGATKIANLSFADVTLLYNAHTSEDIGMEAEVIVSGRGVGHHPLEKPMFLNRANFQKFAMAHGGGFRGNDNDIVSISTILRSMAMKNGGLVYLVNREGLDVIQRPGASQKEFDLIWCSNAEVVSNSPINYKFRGDPNKSGIFHSDLIDAPPLKGTEQEAEVIEALLQVSSPFTVACILGWMVSAFHRQVYYRLWKQFPLLQIFGQAGSGKSETVALFVYMHYFLADPVLAAADLDSNHAIKSKIKSSASIPVVLDEYKPRDFRNGKHAYLRSVFRSAYRADAFATGGRQEEIGSSYRDLHSDTLSGPIVYIGEAMESETAVQERSVSVPMQKSYLSGRKPHFTKAQEHREVLSSLGRDILSCTFSLNWEVFRDQFKKAHEQAEQLIRKSDNHRPVYNLAVVLNGLEFVRQVLALKFGDRFNARIEDLKLALNDITFHVSTSIMSEPAKVLNALALISNTEDSLSEFGLQENREYAFHDDTSIDIRVRNCWVKYVGWAKRKGISPLYDNEEAYLHGLAHFGPLRNKAAALDSSLKARSGEKIYRFDLANLAEEGVEQFKGAA